jgi:hypothetical protein
MWIGFPLGAVAKRLRLGGGGCSIAFADNISSLINISFSKIVGGGEEVKHFPDTPFFTNLQTK